MEVLGSNPSAPTIPEERLSWFHVECEHYTTLRLTPALMSRAADHAKCAHVFYSGRVQGVGFRLTAEEAAVECGVVGWVRNLRDGRVELMAQGAEPVVTKFLDAVRAGPMRNFIDQVGRVEIVN